MFFSRGFMFFSIFVCALANRIENTTPGQEHPHRDHHRSVSNSWPSWFQRRQEASSRSHFPQNDEKSREEKIDETDRYRVRHEAISSSRARAHVSIRLLHDALVRNSRNRNHEEVERGEFSNFFGASNRSNETTRLRKIGEKDSPSRRRWDSWNEATDLTESKTLRPMTSSTTTTTTTDTTTSRDSSLDRTKSEKLTALAASEYAGTRAVAYAGYHHNHDYNPIVTKDVFTPGYANSATPATTVYTKHHPGRRVCTRQISVPPSHHHRSRQYKLVYTEFTSSTFVCCPGWSQVSRTSYGCNRPNCAAPCVNGGVCGPHGKCNCPKAFTGTQCQTDVDECVTEKPCGQLCTNLPGSYECHCRYGFHLMPDGQSCRKNGSDGTAFEARDLESYDYTTRTTTESNRRTTLASHDTENEVGEGTVDQDYNLILRRLAKLEKQIARGRKRDTEATEMGTKITQAIESVAAMRRAVDNVQLMQQEIYDMRGKVKQFELESRKLQHLTNRVADLELRLRLRCRNPING